GGFDLGGGGFGGAGNIKAGAGGGAGMGGAVFNLLGTVTVVNSTVVGNATLGGLMSPGGVPPQPLPDNRAASLGGGVFNLNGTVTVVQSTFAANVAGEGGSVYNLAFPAAQGVPTEQTAGLTLVQSVFADSKTPGAAASASEVSNSRLGRVADATLTASAKNITNGPVVNNGGTADTSGLITVSGPVVAAALADNGGLTRTVALPAGSPAIDASGATTVNDPSLGTPIAFDQRGPGFPRLAGGTIDLGAFEVPLATTTTVTSSLNPSLVGDAVTFTATVSAAVGVPGGSVTFVIDGAPAATVTLTAGAATFTTSTLAVGAHTILAVYPGAPGFVASSGTLTQVVDPLATATAVTSSLNPSLVGDAVTFTATVSAAVGVPGGSVTFVIDGTPAATVALAAGAATFTTNTLAVGNHTVRADYSGAPGFVASSGTLTQVVDPLPPPVRLFAVGAGYTGGPRVRVFNEDGTQRFDFFAFEPELRSGVTVATADVNGDRIEDIIVAPGKGVGPRFTVANTVQVEGFLTPFIITKSGNAALADTGGPRVRVLSGADLSVIADFFALEPEFRGGLRVAAGDVDGDGRAEVFAAAGNTGGPRVRGFRIAPDGQAVPLDGPLGNFFAFDSSLRDGVTIAAGDLDGDGKAELIAGSPGTERAAQQVKVYGPDGAERAAFTPFADFAAARGFDVGVLAARDGAPGAVLAGTVDQSLFWRAFDPLGQSILTVTGGPAAGLSDVAGIDYGGEPAVIAGSYNGDPLFAGVAPGPVSPVPGTDSVVRVYARSGGDPLLEFLAFETTFIGGVSVG
ncbi:MAG TPA: Ig-like domain repeat protein, partial [Fimbriiglobus sp.]|nr:Ig-like domain repeat protein [Fimbriiglobus sp.]